MTNEIITHYLQVCIPRLDQFTDRDNRFVKIVKCIRNITGIGLKDAKDIVDANDQWWHKVPITIKSEWQLRERETMLDELVKNGCAVFIEVEPKEEPTDQSWVKESTPTVEQDYMDTLGNLMEGATPKKDEVASNFRSRAMLVHELKHYIMQATEFREYKMAKYLIDQLANYEET